MFPLLYPVVDAVQPLFVPICFVLAWMLVILMAWNVASAVNHSVASAKRMHQIPCPGCQFFTNDHRLKCTVHPAIANSEEAIDCHDYCPKTNSFYY